MKNFGKLLLLIAGTTIFTLQVNAQSAAASNQPAQKQIAVNSASRNYVDNNNEGICDNYKAKPGNGRGRNFVDKNNDGICDNRANAGKKSGNQYRNGQGNQHRHGQGHGRGCGNCCRR